MTGLKSVPRQLAETFTLLLAPFAPHLAEEVWQRLGHAESLARHPWPRYDEAKLAEATMELPVQVNGKLRDRVVVPQGLSELEIEQIVLAREKVRAALGGRDPARVVHVPGRLVNLVVT